MKRILLLGFLIGWVGACAPDPYLRGLILKDESRYENSLAAFQKVKTSHRLHRYALREISEVKTIISLKNEGEREAAAGNLDAAVTAYEKILKIDPENPGLKTRLSSLREEQQKQLAKKLQKEEILEEIEKTYQGKRFEEASRKIETFLKIDSKNTRAHELQGRIRKSWEEARAASEKHLQRGEKYKETGDLLGACAEFNLAREAWPKNPDSEDPQSQIQSGVQEALAQKVRLVRELMKKGEWEKSLEDLEMNLHCQPRDENSMKLYPKVLRRLAIDAYNKSDYAKAIDYFERERKYNPDDPTLKQYLGKAAKLLKELKRN
jgi:tetratricopeptide (TPR) repeat protein